MSEGRPADKLPLTVEDNNLNSDRVDVTLPNDAASVSGWPAGNWQVSLDLIRPGDTETRTSNSFPLMLAPTLDIAASSVSRDAGGVVTIGLTFTPEARPSQQVSLNAGGQQARPLDLSSQTGSLDFRFPALAAGSQWLRLRIDGVDSLLINRAVQPPEFLASQQMVIPA